MSDSLNNRLQANLMRDLFVFEDERNPASSLINRVYPMTILDQVIDHLSPTRKNLRQLLNDLKMEIITGGIGNIIFPLTHVNGKTGGEIWLTANDFGLGRVDNTRDMDKPLSIPQRNAMMEVLRTYNFNTDNINFNNMEQLMKHLTDYNNPHKFTIDNLETEEFNICINKLIAIHNLNTTTSTHPDIRRSITTLWQRVDAMDGGLEDRIDNVLKVFNGHFNDPDAHTALFARKEDIGNKVFNFDTKDIDHTHYATTKAIVDHITYRFDRWKEQYPAFSIEEYISNLQVASGQAELPPPEKKHYRRSLLLKRSGSLGIEMALAVCRLNTNGEYWWDITPAGGISLFDPTYFIPKAEGMSINLPTMLKEIYEDGMLQKFYDREEADKRFLTGVTIIGGNMDGHLQYYINGDVNTKSDNIAIPGLRSLAYRDWVTENEIRDIAVHNRHLMSRSVDARVLQEKLLGREHFRDEFLTKLDSLDSMAYLAKGNLLGNIMHDDGTIHGINLQQLGDLLRPIIGGWPDVIENPSGGSSFSIEEVIEALSRIINPEFMSPNVEYKNPDGSFLVRFKGNISRIPNQTDIQQLSLEFTSDRFRLIDVKGSWCYQSDNGAEAVLGGTNLTGHTYAWVNMTHQGIQFESLSTGNRINAYYDLTIQLRRR